MGGKVIFRIISLPLRICVKSTPKAFSPLLKPTNAAVVPAYSLLPGHQQTTIPITQEPEPILQRVLVYLSPVFSNDGGYK